MCAAKHASGMDMSSRLDLIFSNDENSIDVIDIGEPLRKHVPSHRKRTFRPAAPRWNVVLTKEVKAKYKAFKAYCETKPEEDHRKYVTQRNQTTSKIKEARRKYENSIISSVKEKPKRMYKYIRSQQKSRPTIQTLENGRGYTENECEAAAVLQIYFMSVFVNEGDGPVPPFPAQVDPQQKLEVILVEKDIREVLEGLNEHKIPGPDNIPNIILKKCATELVCPLLKLFKKTVSDGRLPQDWKNARIVPIHKSRSRGKPENYRPVSMTSHICKVMERIIKSRIMSHLQESNLLTRHQHGFINKKSCQSNLLEALEYWTEAMDKRQGLDILYLDFRKAFDSVPHKRLIAKLRGYGIQGRLLNWITAFLQGRKQQVVVGQGFSDWDLVTSGIPQGSVLGPTLFVVYVNELPNLVQSNIKMFADDVKLYRTVCGKQDT